MTPERFRDRREAGRLLAAKLAGYANRRDVVVLALPRGGVPIAYKVARALRAPLDVFVVRKLGVPGYEELAMGAVATGGLRVLNDQIVQDLRIPDYVIDRVAAEEGEEFTQTTDQEVRELLARRQHPEEVPPTASDIDSTPREALRAAAHRLTGAAEDYDPLMDLIGDARFVLLGEASHGTHEFYRERARITQRLIDEKGFAAVAVEADWPDAYRVNRYVRGAGDDFNAAEALADFRRFPRWMWRNTEVVEFIEWLRAHRSEERRV